MSAAWPKVPFEAIYAEPSKNGVYKSKEFHGSGAKIVNMGELFGYEFIGSQEMKRIQMTEAELEKSGLADGDLLFGRRSLVEEGAGKCSIVKSLNDNTTFESSLIRVRLDQSEALPDFYYYWFKSHVGRAGIKAIVTGTNVKGIKSSNLKKVLVAKPDLPTQKSVVELISKYDELIENNKRRIELLEESARQLYKEWFVRFRFPGHEHAKIIDGVPEGWQRLTVAECCEKPTYGYTASADVEPIGPKFLRITDIVPSSIDWPNVPHCLADENTTKKYLLYKGDIVVARTGATVGYAKLMPELNEEVVYASYLVRFRPKPDIIDEQILGIFVESEGYKEHVRAHAGGAAQPNANAQVLGSAKLNVPPPTLQIQFKDFVEPVLKQKSLLEKTNFSLAKARDLLLPKLMSGEVAV